MSFLLELTRFRWWLYLLVIFSFFFVALVLNYIVKKINEARLEGRLVRLRNKASNTRSIQVQRQLETLASRSPPNVMYEQTPTVAGISMVYNRDDNLKENSTVIGEAEVQFPDSKEVSSTVVNKDDSMIESVKHVDKKENTLKLKSNELAPKPGFLETVYQELNAGTISNDMQKSKSLAIPDREKVLEKIVDKIVLKIKETKSAPSFKIKNEEDLRKWALDLLEKHTPEDKPTTST